jgi:hypothetical protein
MRTEEITETLAKATDALLSAKKRQAEDAATVNHNQYIAHALKPTLNLFKCKIQASREHWGLNLIKISATILCLKYTVNVSFVQQHHSS